MRAVPGGRFVMGSDDHYPEEAPRSPASVEPFWMDAYAVTNGQYAAFVAATGYCTVAERSPDPVDFPGADPKLLVPGSLVFRPPPGGVDLRRPTWWAWAPGASWRSPEGPDSSIEGRDGHPIVHVAADDAAAYADWAGTALPTEAEWERAARSGLPDAEYAWGTEFTPSGRQLANTWQGVFPYQNLCLDGYAGTSPVGSYPPNAYGIYDLIGNVWEWTATPYDERRRPEGGACCGGSGAPAHDVSEPDAQLRVLKGGSYLCAPNYCARYRPAARVGQDVKTGTAHTGFRCVVRLGH